jgi:DNA-binding transcriptional ArsR family regulator
LNWSSAIRNEGVKGFEEVSGNDPQNLDYVDESIAKALAHPVRVLILAEANKRILSPKQFADRHDLVVSNVSYHFRQLEKYKCVEVVREKKVRGAIEHFYKATRRALFDGKPWDELPLSVKEDMSGDTFANILKRVSDAMAMGTFDARNERFLVWNKQLLDEEGWREIADIYRTAARKTMAAETRARKRVEESGAEGIPSTWAFLFFQSPWMEPPADEGDERK